MFIFSILNQNFLGKKSRFHKCISILEGGQLYYFKVMIQVWSRRLQAFGIHPYWLILLPFLVFGLITFMFWKTSAAGYLVLLGVLNLLFTQVSAERMSLLESCFSIRQQRLILLCETAIWLIPITVILLYYGAYLPLAIIVFVAILWLMFPKFRIKSRFSFPKSMQRLLSRLAPFEFQTGLRRYFGGFLFGLIGIVLGEVVNNTYISIFAFGIFGLIYVGMHRLTEPFLWVWISTRNAKQFLVSKMIQAIWHVLILSGPLFILILLLQPANWWSAGLLLLLHVYFAQITLLMKYSVFPAEIGVAAEIVLSLLILFVPIGIIYSPFLFKKSVKQISWILP